MSKWVALLACIVFTASAQAQVAVGASPLRTDADLLGEGPSLSAGLGGAAGGTVPPGAREGRSEREACAAGDTRCAAAQAGEATSKAGAVPELQPSALVWAALGVVAFVALRRRPRP